MSLKYRGAYNASKFAVEALSDAMRQELAGTGIHVCLIEPGPIESKFTQQSLAAYKANIDLAGSAHADVYKIRIAKMEADIPSLFKLGPEAVLKKLIHALESPRPHPRYYVTKPAYMLGWTRRLFSTRMADRLLARR